MFNRIYDTSIASNNFKSKECSKKKSPVYLLIKLNSSLH